MEQIDCGVIRDLLPLCADGVASPEGQALVQRHLEQCPECKREMEAMKRPVALPPEGGKQLKRFARRWSWRRMTAAVAATALLCVTAAAGFLFRGRAAYGEVVCRTGFQCDNVSDTENPNGLPTWGLWLTPQETPLVIRRTFAYGDLTANGEPVPVEVCFNVYETGWGQADGTWVTGFDFPDDWVLPEDYDCTVRIVFKDRELVYSMREEGLFDPDTPHDPQCCFDCHQGQ